MVVLEKINAPASRNRAAGGASAAAGTSIVVAAPSGTGTPLVAIFSLIVAGTPSSGPMGSPFCQRSVEAFAVARAPSGSNAYSALMCGSHTAMCASRSSSTSDGENCFARKPAIRSTALRSCSDVTASRDADLCMGTHRQSGFDDACEHAGADRQDLVVEHVAGIMYRHRRLEGIDVAADDGLQRLSERDCDHDGILRALRHGAVRAIAVDGDVEEVSACHGGSWKDRKLAVVQVGRIVQPVDLVAGKFLEQPVLDHGAGAAEAFFGRLEDEMHGAVEIPGLREIARGAQQHGGMAVMAAAVEAAGNGRAPSQIGIFFHRQRIHVGAQANASAAAALALEHADHAGAEIGRASCRERV